jgi:hypothetical protein
MPLIITRHVYRHFIFIVINPTLIFENGEPIDLVSFSLKKVEFLPGQFTEIDKWAYCIVDDRPRQYSLRGVCRVTTPITELEFRKFHKDLMGVSLEEETRYSSYVGCDLSLFPETNDRPHTPIKYSPNYHDKDQLTKARPLEINSSDSDQSVKDPIPKKMKSASYDNDVVMLINTSKEELLKEISRLNQLNQDMAKKCTELAESNSIMTKAFNENTSKVLKALENNNKKIEESREDQKKTFGHLRKIGLVPSGNV